jgi:hypothetical protein
MKSEACNSQVVKWGWNFNMFRFQKLVRSALRILYLDSAGYIYASHIPPIGYRSSDAGLSLTSAAGRFANRNALYRYMHYWFARPAPEWLREHRRFFSQQSRGFGEDAFHAMWFKLLAEYRPRRCLEIGVYRGQVISLWILIAEKIGFPVEVHGISPFSAAGDTVSQYLEGLDYHADVLANCARFSSKRPDLLRAYSTEPEAVALINMGGWDLIYIDGSHEEEVVRADYRNCAPNLSPLGLLVFDDASLYTDYWPPPFAFAGHPGPSRIVRDTVANEMHLVAAVGHNNIFCGSNFVKHADFN